MGRADFFSSFLWEKVPRKILQENPRQNPPKLTQQKSPTHFCRGAGPTFHGCWLCNYCSLAVVVSAIFASRWYGQTTLRTSGLLWTGGLVGKCSATRYSVAAPPPGARQGLGGPMCPRRKSPRGGIERERERVRKVWVSIEFLSAKLGFTPLPPKGPKTRKNCTNQ